MTEERIRSAAETIHSANRLSITKGILSTIAAEAREGGIDEMRDDLCTCEDELPPCRACERAERLKEAAK